MVDDIIKRLEDAKEEVLTKEILSSKGMATLIEAMIIILKENKN